MVKKLKLRYLVRVGTDKKGNTLARERFKFIQLPNDATSPTLFKTNPGNSVLITWNRGQNEKKVSLPRANSFSPATEVKLMSGTRTISKGS